MVRGAGAVAALALALAFLVLPVVAIFTDAGPSELIASLDDPAPRDALWLSLQTTADRARDHRRRRHAGRLPAGDAATSAARAVVVTLIELPLVLPPAVAGIALLAALGPHGHPRRRARRSAVELVFQTRGASSSR